MRLYIDHDVDVGLAERLRRRGHDVLTTLEASNTEASDESQLAFATTQERIFLTHNRRDFRRLHRLWTEGGRMHYGIVISAHIPLLDLERRMLRLLSTYTLEDLRGRLIPLHEFR